MKRWVKKTLIGVGVVAVLLGGSLGSYVYALSSAYEESMNKVYDVPMPKVERSTDPDVLARGKHLAESLAGCATSDCHGADLGGGKKIEIGPIGMFCGPNITSGGLGAAYTDGELARLIRHGLKKDGRSVRFMPAHEINWLPESDIVALISVIRVAPAVNRPIEPTEIKTLGKVLDRRGMIPIDIARRINHEKIELAPPPTGTAAYGRFIGKLCTGCHGEKLSGGPIPGAPPNMPVPTNITPHETGLKSWSFEDFERLLNTGIRKNGTKVDSMMPTEALGKLDSVEKHALWEHLRTVPPVAFGNR